MSSDSENDLTSTVSSQKPPPAPRMDGLKDPRASFLAHIVENGLAVISVMLLFGLTTAAILWKALPAQAEYAYVGAAVTIVVMCNTVAISYFFHRERVIRGNRLFTFGLARQAVVIYIGVATPPGSSEEPRNADRYCWVVKWRYTVKGVIYKGVSPLSNIPSCAYGDKLWILIDPMKPNVARRWEAYQQSGIHIGTSEADKISYASPCPPDPRYPKTSLSSNV